jgi:hypothetical protein
MLKEAAKFGFFDTGFGKYPRLQVLTISEVLHGKQPRIPLVDPDAFRRAKLEVRGDQKVLF